ncbi:MAG: ATP-binding protein [Spirochaetes bacterium]|jgi:signal transduction histidine kinase|nr:ATP-binding protein [Spirochaetota bacterium]
MKIKKALLHLSIYIPDIVLFAVLIKHGVFDFSRSDHRFLGIVFFLVKILIHNLVYLLCFVRPFTVIKDVLMQFQRGRYSMADNFHVMKSSVCFGEILELLRSTGRYLDNLIGSQNDEIEKFRELYNNVILASNSYFVVLNSRDEIIFSNKSFSANFRYIDDEILGLKLEDVFYIIPGRLSDAIENVKKRGESAVLRKIKLISKRKISLIADIKISRVTIQGEKQYIVVLDDITSQWRKDYQISLISQISESIQRDDEVERILHAILTAVTSGSGLGFNRAMLFLYNDQKKALTGKMAVGPDSMEEAVQIWGAVQNEELNLMGSDNESVPSASAGNAFYKQVITSSFPINSDSLLVNVFNGRSPVHIYDASADPRVDPETREFTDVSEFVVVPLCSANKSLGVIVADNKFNGAPIYEDHVELLSIFASQASLSIDSYNSLSLVKERMEHIQAKQEAIIESEKMAAVGRIAAHIAHEIRNPLVTVGGYARRILQTVKKAPKGTEDIGKAASIILHESERLEKILSNVMDFSRPSPLIREYNNLNDVVKDTYYLLKNVFQERKITPVLELEQKLPLVKSDFNQLKQVVLNLLQNAMDATPTGGKITLKTGLTETHIFIRIRDTGSGISDEVMDKIFDPFFTSKITGVGLGLAVVKKIVNDHNGEIVITNNPEGGCQFSIELLRPS